MSYVKVLDITFIVSFIFLRICNSDILHNKIEIINLQLNTKWSKMIENKIELLCI
jgi:hypothetical protein